MGLLTSVISYLQYMHNIYKIPRVAIHTAAFFSPSKDILITTAKLNLPVHTLRLTMQSVRNKALRTSCATKKEIHI